MTKTKEIYDKIQQDSISQLPPKPTPYMDSCSWKRPEFTKEIYDKIQEAISKLPPEAIEQAKKEVTRKGYDTTGYQYQFLVNVLNEVVGVNNWYYDYKIIKEIAGQWSNGKSYFEITIEMEITILDAKRKTSGGHKSESYFDTHKGAITNSIKKTLGMFGIGKKAFEGTLDEDFQPVREEIPVARRIINHGADLKPRAKLNPRQQSINVNVWGNCPDCGFPLAQSKYNYGELYCTNYKEGCKYKKTIKESKPLPQIAKPTPEQEIKLDEIPF